MVKAHRCLQGEREFIVPRQQDAAEPLGQSVEGKQHRPLEALGLGFGRELVVMQQSRQPDEGQQRLVPTLSLGRAAVCSRTILAAGNPHQLGQRGGGIRQGSLAEIDEVIGGKLVRRDGPGNRQILKFFEDLGEGQLKISRLASARWRRKLLVAGQLRGSNLPEGDFAGAPDDEVPQPEGKSAMTALVFGVRDFLGWNENDSSGHATVPIDPDDQVWVQGTACGGNFRREIDLAQGRTAAEEQVFGPAGQLVAELAERVVVHGRREHSREG